ncbi:exodeoxyribonuclease VII small subunit [Geothermobacter ehrlichii]|uniref:Exodeoxyribonuclease 7 small subunit n=1 Tax=Geothermobacter ehrlichii TaxID=213224 RepID=A0A5D3WKW8_9BACT|nr:exodeoxyribonuclease VII small subunit [Geothermobacter ehrlichii]TYO98750.1 exodeoxyribonuclease VII small subunit [Geothermobacter ehrlichii]
MTDISFEQALKELEALVERLESGDLPLEESLRCFEEGIARAAACQKRLQQAEARIEQLLHDDEGNLRIEPFADGED